MRSRLLFRLETFIKSINRCFFYFIIILFNFTNRCLRSLVGNLMQIKKKKVKKSIHLNSTLAKNIKNKVNRLKTNQIIYLSHLRQKPNPNKWNKNWNHYILMRKMNFKSKYKYLNIKEINSRMERALLELFRRKESSFLNWIYKKDLTSLK